MIPMLESIEESPHYSWFRSVIRFHINSQIKFVMRYGTSSSLSDIWRNWNGRLLGLVSTRNFRFLNGWSHNVCEEQFLLLLSVRTMSVLCELCEEYTSLQKLDEHTIISILVKCIFETKKRKIDNLKVSFGSSVM